MIITKEKKNIGFKSMFFPNQGLHSLFCVDQKLIQIPK